MKRTEYNGTAGNLWTPWEFRREQPAVAVPEEKITIWRSIRVETKESILQNRRDLCVLLNLDKQAFTAGEQVHSCNSRILNNLPVEPLDETDALLVTAPGILAVIFTADCLPVILYDPAGKRGAVIHAGWKGMARGIIPSVLSRMVEELGSRKEDILAVTGPAIGSCCYQIDTPVFRIMTENFPETKNAFTPDGRNHWRLSLEKAAVQQLNSFRSESPWN